jgi:hypothetical protein
MVCSRIVLLVCALLGCASLGGATSSPPPDRLSPEQLKHGPSMYETGRFAVVPPSSGGLKVDEGAIDRPPPARPPRARVAERQHGKRKSRAPAQRLP